ncbi:MAG: hypothetical protein J7L96_10720, partial [Bacteroidales bacterium]|nr:hypothetical protein [Bacteroidales bacterium]
MNILITLLAVTMPSNSLNNNENSFDQESDFQFEDWMFVELCPSDEAEFQMEEWMFEELIPEYEEDNIIEAWMIEPLIITNGAKSSKYECSKEHHDYLGVCKETISQICLVI